MRRLCSNVPEGASSAEPARNSPDPAGNPRWRMPTANPAPLIGAARQRVNACRHALAARAAPLAQAQPVTLKAARAAMLTSWASLAERGTICTGRSSPTRIGPITVAPPSSVKSLVEIEAE